MTEFRKRKDDGRVFPVGEGKEHRAVDDYHNELHVLRNYEKPRGYKYYNYFLTDKGDFIIYSRDGKRYYIDRTNRTKGYVEVPNTPFNSITDARKHLKEHMMNKQKGYHRLNGYSEGDCVMGDGLPAEQGAVVIAIGDYDRVKQYDKSGGMAEYMSYGYRGRCTAVKLPDGDTAVYATDEVYGIEKD